MKTTWNWSLELEANRILQAAKNIGSGFYHTNNFPILPWTPDLEHLSQAVYLPALNYSTLPRFWHKVAKYDISTLPTQDPNNFTPALLTKLTSLNLTNPTNPQLLSTWDKHQNSIITTINNVLPHTTNSLTSIHLYPTHFGTSSSFNSPTSFPTDIHIFLRHDQGIHSLVESLLSALTQQDSLTNYHALWSESELLVDYLITRTPITTLLNKIDPHTNYLGTIQQTRSNSNINNQTLQDSHSFLTSIGAPTFNQPFSVTDNSPQFNNSPIQHLTIREQAILTLLIQHSPHLITYDNIADLIFIEDNDYSLQTITKVVERLRKKLDKQGISSSHLCTTRNQGYYLKN